MFGYVSINPQALTEEDMKRFRAAYCGLCHVLSERYGNAGRITLSNDMTFLSLVLGALYEPMETAISERCMLHPIKKHDCAFTVATGYAADMNVILAYHKCLDDMHDEHALRGRAGCAALKKAYAQVEARYPVQCETVKTSLEKLSALEKEKSTDLDALSKLSGQMLGACFGWKDDVFKPHLMEMGDALGRFIYLMDAYEDYDSDMRHGQFNPLVEMHAQEDYEERIEEILTMQIAACARAFEFLPIEQDEKLIRNILYSGIWGKFAYLRKKRKETKQ